MTSHGRRVWYAEMRVLLVVYDNDSYIHWFPIGLSYIAAVLKQHHIDVEIYNQDVHHYSDDNLTEHLNKNKFDIVGYSTIGGYYQYRKLLGISDAINKSKNRPFYILGGHGPSPEPDYFLKKTQADVIVMGEGEETIIELLDAIANHKPLSNVTIKASAMTGPGTIAAEHIEIAPMGWQWFPAEQRWPPEVCAAVGEGEKSDARAHCQRDRGDHQRAIDEAAQPPARGQRGWDESPQSFRRPSSELPQRRVKPRGQKERLPGGGQGTIWAPAARGVILPRAALACSRSENSP